MKKGRKPSAHRTNWTKQEDMLLKKLICAATSRPDIAKEMHRTVSAINSRVFEIGLSVEKTKSTKPVVKVQKTKPVVKKDINIYTITKNTYDKYIRFVGDLQFWADWNELEFRGIELMKDGTGIIARFKV